MKKKIIFILSLVMLISVLSPAMALESVKEDRICTIQERAQGIVENSNTIIGNVIPLFNLSDTIEALCFQLKPTGYIIISYKNGNLIEYSLEAPCPYARGNKNIYNGPFQYFVEVYGMIEHTITKEKYLKQDVIKALDEPYIATLPTKNLTRRTRSWVQNGITGSLTTSIKTQQGYYCVPTAVAIVLRYLGAYPAGHSDARSYLKDNFYVADMPQWLTETKNGVQSGIWTYTGLQSYFNSGVVTQRTVNVVGYTYSRLNTQVVTNKRPVILEIPTELVDTSKTGYHAVTAYAIGYSTDNPNETEICVNDGWGHNGVNIIASYMPTSYDMMYLS